ncbi:MAG TPA: YfhO family protein [Acidimicrobiales bacterium]|nr:YfhO family protein [Acidimicrobiales bacterium]
MPTQTRLPPPLRTSRPRPPASARQPAPRRSFLRRRGPALAAYAGLAAAVVAYTGAWRTGALTLDGPGVSMWLRLLLRHWRAGDGIPSWIPEMWSGAPMWELVSAFHLVVLLPLAGLFGPDTAVKIAVIGAQVVGAWGAFVLARSLWSNAGVATVAGLLYGLHPLFASHGALSGHQPSVWVFAATPWLAWSMQRGLRGLGSRYVAIAGLLAGFAVIEQAEHAYALFLLCAFLLALEVARARRGSGPKGVPGVFVRAGAMVALAVGLSAHWLLPFMSTGESFVLMPSEDVRAGMELFGGGLSDSPGAFLTRAEPLKGNMDFEKLLASLTPLRGPLASGFYLSWVCVVLALVTVVWLCRRPDDDDGTISALLLASATGLWLSIGSVSLADGGPAARGRVLALALMGAVIGLLVGVFLRRLDLGRRTATVAAVAAVALFAVPFVAPLTTLRQFIPLLQALRFPRFYPIAALGLALAAAYPALLVQRWAAAHRPHLAPLLTASLCLAVVAAFLVDINPYRSFYRLDSPQAGTAFDDVAASVAFSGTDVRVATPYFGDPRPVANLLESGLDVSVGWPQPQATPNGWRLTGDALGASPPGFRTAALGLSATAFLAAEEVEPLGSEPRRTLGVILEPNPSVLPMVRAYEQVVVAPDNSLTPELATALATRYMGVVTGGTGAAEVLGADAYPLGTDRPCREPAARGTEAWVTTELATACALHNWVGVRDDPGDQALGDDLVGAAFTSAIDNLRGVTVWLEGGAGSTELVLLELAEDGSLGPELRRARAAGIDEYGMAQFPFEPVAASAGRRYVFLLACRNCGESSPKLRTTGMPRLAPNLVVADRFDDKRAAAFSLQYDRRPVAEPPAVTLRATRPGPGRWNLEVDGARPSMVVVAESWFPGWKATVDGDEVTVLEADGAFLGVPVPAGPHRLALHYERPATAGIGRWVTGLTLLASLAMVVAPGQPGRRRRRRRSPGAGDTLQMGTPPGG